MKARPFYRQRPLVSVAAAYGLGVGMGVFLPWEPVLWGAGLLCAALLILLLPYAGRSRAAGCMALFLFVGALRAGYAAHPVLPPEGFCRVEGTAVHDFAIREDGKAAGYLENAVWRGENGEGREGRVYWTYTPDEEAPFLPKEGERVAVSGSLYHPQGRVNPYGFDFRLFLLQQGVSAGFSGAQEPETLSHPGRGLRSVLYQARKGLEEKLRLVFGEDSALPDALLLGIRDDLPQETRTGFERAGAAHILSISGLHVGLLAGVVLALLKRFCGPKARLAVLGAFLLGYCALLDFPTPVTRASLLILLSQLRGIPRRAQDELTLLAAAFLLILLISPLALFSAGFVLSFCAVLGICLWGNRFYAKTAFLRVHWLRHGVSASFAATLGILLPTVYYFHRVSLIGLLLNPFLCALFQVLLPAYAAVLLLGCLWLPLGQALAFPIRFITRWAVAGVNAAGSLPLAAVALPSPPWYSLLLLLLAAALVCRFSALPKAHGRRLGAAAAALSVLLWAGLKYRGVSYIQFAVGQADAALLMDGSYTTLIDVGEYGGDVTDYLLANGRRADRVILTHLHSDHCMGLNDLMEDEVPIGEVWLPEGAEACLVSEDVQALMERVRAAGIPVRCLYEGDTLETERTRVTALWPQRGKVEPGIAANRYPLVTLIEMDGVRLLSMSDLEGRYEQYAMADADILKVSHHGSKSGTGAAFLSAVRSRYALIAGGDNGRGLPDGETLSRLAEAGVLVYNTGETGAVTLRVRNGQGTWSTFLKLPEGGSP